MTSFWFNELLVRVCTIYRKGLGQFIVEFVVNILILKLKGLIKMIRATPPFISLVNPRLYDIDCNLSVSLQFRPISHGLVPLTSF